MFQFLLNIILGGQSFPPRLIFLLYYISLPCIKMAQYSPIQIKVAVSAVFSVRSLPSVNMKDEKNHTDILRWLQSWFGFQVNDLFCFMQNA